MKKPQTIILFGSSNRIAKAKNVAKLTHGGVSYWVRMETSDMHFERAAFHAKTPRGQEIMNTYEV